MDSLERTEFGFRWNAAHVQRFMSFQGAVCVAVEGANGREVQVWVSKNGRSVRTFIDGVEQARAKPRPKRRSK